MTNPTSIPSGPVVYDPSNLNPVTSSVPSITVGGSVASASVAAGVSNGNLVTGSDVRYDLGGVVSGDNINASSVGVGGIQQFHQTDSSVLGGTFTEQKVDASSLSLTGASQYTSQSQSAFGFGESQSQFTSVGVSGVVMSSSASDTCCGKTCIADSFSCKDGVICSGGCNMCGDSCSCSDASCCSSIASCAQSVLCAIPNLVKDCECGCLRDCDWSAVGDALCCIVKCIGEVLENK